MMKIKTIVILNILLIGAILGYFFFINTNDNPEIPDINPRSGNENMSAEYINAIRSVDHLRILIQKFPDDPKNYVKLSQIFLQQSRVTGKHHEYLPKAEILLDEALRIDPDNFQGLATKASMLMTLHQFKDAKKMAEKAQKINPYNAFNYGVLVDANVELGNYDKAIKYCDKMISIRPDLRSYARASYLRELFGKTKEAENAMQMASNAGLNGKVDRAWTLFNLGNLYFKSGKVDTAEYIFNGILEERPNYAFALSGLAKVYVVKKNYGKAIKLLVQATQNNPNHLFLQQLSDIYMLTNQKESENEINKKILDAFELHKKDGFDIHYEYAKFCLDHNINLKKALYHAKEEYNIRPKNIDALDTYAWALYKNGKAKEALPFLKQALRLNTKRARFHYHAAEIYYANNMNYEAQDMIEKAFKDDPNVGIIYLSSAKKLYNSFQNLAKN